MNSQSNNLRIFTIIWIGQVASILGSRMTNFAVIIWAWQLTGEATPLSLLAFFTEIPILFVAIFAGAIIDRWNRKGIMILGDVMAGLSTIVILFLFLTNNLAIWHLYLIGAVNGLFGYLQELAFSASKALIVPKKHYIRVGAMTSIKTFGTGIFAPALAGLLYYSVGLSGILMIDLITFLIAISTLSLVTIPQPKISNTSFVEPNQRWQQLTLGFRYLWKRPSLMALQIFSLSYIFFDTASGILAPMILARTGNNTAILGSVQGAVGLGGLVGAILLGMWGGPQRPIQGVLIGRALVFGAEMVLGLTRIPAILVGANFTAGLFKPLANSCESAIWLSKIEPTIQGRVFATTSFFDGITYPLGLLIAGPLADFFFEPAMMPDGFLAPFLGVIFGTDRGSGMALQFSLFSLIVVFICLGGYLFPPLRDIEDVLPDHDSVI
ncbi:MFS transporter [Cyanobacterium aponinum UTEX 3221]|uniref:MFS transporter n=1 Tax=Cyanobacterium aponinum TaxID=379064 RepID=UPI002B4C01E7|nr:MFS transporter [Cyanobacterium aponinum]WRL38566.1 MFS transporter [Cyanobacterium aponinum UTEX 3221]